MKKLILQQITITKQRQIDEQQETLNGLMKSIIQAKIKELTYKSWADEYMNPHEMEALELAKLAGVMRGEAIQGLLASIPAFLLPNIFGFSDGGMQFGSALSTGADVVQVGASILDGIRDQLITKAQYDRRRGDWRLQAQLATSEIEQLEHQIAAARIRLDITRREFELHQKQIEHNQEIEDYFETKFTNQELYQWMVGKLMDIYSQSYRIAFQYATRVENAYRYELVGPLPSQDKESVRTIKKDDTIGKYGLLAGESLMLMINQLGENYVNNSTRKLEIQKIVSLRKHLHLETNEKKGDWDDLITSRTITFDFFKDDFDADFPNHYQRQIKTISITIPAVVGPYQNIYATLTQTTNTIFYGPDQGSEQIDWRKNQQIVLSTGVNDSGQFELNFHDDRYLPFEGTGAISSWELEFSDSFKNSKSLNNPDDIIITLRYTARTKSAQTLK